MRLDKGETLDVVSIGSDVMDKKSSISEENIPLVLSLVSRGIYKNPIGSIIREITSNCADAHTELGVKKPILINLSYDHENSCYYIEFIDKGIGMSEDRIQNVYANFFSSTKRATDSLIGGFGLGSKSLLSYNDIFYITTIYDNIKYEYTYYKDGDDYIVSLMNKCNVLEKSGTTIRMDIKYGDKDKFLKEIKQQLSYFEDVYINTSYRQYNNDFTIYEGKYFKFKSEDRPYNEMHIVLGQVTYPIDFNLLGMKAPNIPIAVKFDIGELKPTLERENIKYEEKYIEIMKAKIKLAFEEIKEYFKDQTFELNDLREYVEKREDSPILYFDKDKEHGFKAYREDFGKSDYVFKPLEDIKIPTNNIFFMYHFHVIQNGKHRPISEHDFMYSWKRGQPVIIKENGAFSSAHTSYFTDYTFVASPKKFSYREGIRFLGLNSYKYGNNYISSLSGLGELEKLHNKNQQTPFEFGNSKIIHKYVTEIRNYINSISTKYEDVPNDYIENYRQERRQEYLDAKNIEKERVIYRNEYNTYKDIQLKKLLSYRFIFYCLKEENYDVNLYKEIIQRSNFKSNDFIFIKLSNTQYQKIKKYKLVHMSEFVKSKKLINTLYKIKLANYIKYKLRSSITYGISLYYYNLNKKLKEFVDRYHLDLEEIKVNTHKRKHNCCWEITKLFGEYLRTKDKLDIFNYISSNIPKQHLKTIIKSVDLIKLHTDRIPKPIKNK